MNLPINLKTMAIVLFLSFGSSAKADVFETNPGEIAAVIKGEAEVNGKISEQIATQTATNGLIFPMYQEMHTMKKWERNYINYLEKGYNFASTVLACSSLYADGIQTFINLMQLEKALSHNPQGPFATVSMTNIYVEVGTELIEIYKLIKIASSPNKYNLLTGAERSEILWYLSQKFTTLNRKLHKMALSIAMYTFQDVWNQATMGMASKSHGQLAKEAFGRMKNACNACNTLYFNNQ